jgi:hypothetical protein
MATKKKNLKKSAKATAKAPTGTATANPQAAPAQAPQPDPTALSIGDLKNLSTILDVASTRGAFKANEMAGVGFLYNKLQAFLAKVAPEQKPEGTPTVGQAEAGQAPAPTQEK